MPSEQSGRWGRFLNGSLMVLVLATCLGVWFRTGPLTSTAEAQIPNAGLQRKQQLEAAQLTNKLLEEIKGILESKTLKVRIEEDKKK